MAGKWYKTGFEDGLKGLSQDPPWNPGHRDHTAYCEGFVDGERQAERNARKPAEEAARWREGFVGVNRIGMYD